MRVSGDPDSANNGRFYIHSDHPSARLRTSLGSTRALTKQSDGYIVSGSLTRYTPFGAYRTGGPNAITDRAFTGQKENMSLGLYYYNARFYAPGIGRFLSADTLVPDPMNPQQFNRYAYSLNSPVNLRDPSGHCPGYPGDGMNNTCWDFLTGNGNDSFCQGSGIDICDGGDWTHWFVFEMPSMQPGPRFKVPWSKGELSVLRDAIADMISALNNIGIAWQDTPLNDTKYSKDTFPRPNPWTNPFTGVIHLKRVNTETIWHETGHSLDFGSWGRLHQQYASSSGNCANHGMGGIYCSNTAIDGFYYRNYGWNASTVYGSVYGMVFSQHETFADAFAAWVYHNTNNGTDPTMWTAGRTQNAPYSPHWKSIYDAVTVSLNHVFK